MIRFSLATRETGHFGKFHEGHERVTVNPSEIPVLPKHPEDQGFWKEFEDVVDAVGLAKTKSRYTNAIASCFENIGIKTADRAAKLVSSDWPSDLIQIIAKDVLKQEGTKFREILPGPFVDKVVLLDRLFGELAHVVAANSGAAKWGNELARPQEIAWLIANEKLKAPPLIIAKLRELEDFEKLTQGSLETHSRWFTLQGIGAPPHCSWIAMHSSAVEASCYALRVMVEMTEATLSDCILAVNNVGGFRTLLGVHYEQDNIAGYWLGQETAKRYLPDFFRSFGADMGLLKAAMKKAEVDWLASY